MPKWDIAFQKGNYSKATELFRKAIATKPNFERAGICYKQAVLQELAEQGMKKT
jgi:hypothetical protein